MKNRLGILQLVWVVLRNLNELPKRTVRGFCVQTLPRPLDPGLEDEIPYKLEAQGLKNPRL